MQTQDQLAPGMKPQFQIDLRSAFAVTLSVAIGLTVGAAPSKVDATYYDPFDIGIPKLDWHFALLAAASTLIAINLLKEAFALQRQRRSEEENSYALGLAVEVAGRSALATILLASLTIRLLVVRGLVVLPENENGFFYFGDVMTTHVWWLALGIAIAELLQSLKPRREMRPRRIVSTFTTLAAVALGAYVLRDLLAVTFLVHLACHGVDVSQPGVYQRYLWLTQVEEVVLTSSAAFAFASVPLAAICLGRGIQQQPGRRRRLQFSIGALLLLGAAVYTVWFFWRVMPAISPDLAEAGGSGTWFELLGGGVLAGMAVYYAACRISRVQGSARHTFSEKPQTDVGMLFSILVLFIAAVVYFVQYTRSMSDSTFMDLADVIAYSLTFPDTYFMFAITVLSVQLAWVAWRRGNASTLTVHAIDGRRFAAAIVAFSALTIVAIPTFIAAGFGLWLGPWYRW